MTFFSLLVAFLVEQLRPLRHDNRIYRAFSAYADGLERRFNASQFRHGVAAWMLAVLPAVLLVLVVQILLYRASPLLAWVWNVAVLYLMMGFRQFSHYFTDTRDALERGDETEACRLLAEWRHLDASELPRTEVLRHVIEHALLAAHRHVFGVFFWFVVLSALGLGPMGAVFYRMAEFSARYWSYRQRTLDAPANDALKTLSRRLFSFIDHLPARLTAFGFAVVGNFEEAVAGWRRDSALWQHANEGIILAAAAGALGVQLGGAAAPGVTPDRSKTFTAGGEADIAAAQGSTAGVPPQTGHLQSVVGLVWRSVVLWMLLVALLSLANVLG